MSTAVIEKRKPLPAESAVVVAEPHSPNAGVAESCVRSRMWSGQSAPRAADVIDRASHAMIAPSPAG